MNIAELFVRLSADTSGLKKGMAEGSRSMDALKGAALRLGGVLSAGALFRGIIKNSVEAQASLAQLNAVITSTGGAAGRSATELTAQADALAKVTVFGDDAIVSAQALLLTFTKIQGTTFDRATETVLDLATAMGNGEGGLKSASIQVGKALNDPIKGITALTKVGVSFTGAQKDLIKRLVETGDAAGAQAVILKELQVEFGGSAVAARQTLGGALAGLSNAWGDALEVSGSASAGIAGAINGIAEVIPAVRAHVNDFFTLLQELSINSAVNVEWLRGVWRAAMLTLVEFQAALGSQAAKDALPVRRKDVEDAVVGFGRMQAAAVEMIAKLHKVLPPLAAVGAATSGMGEAAEASTKRLNALWDTMDAITEMAEQDAIRRTQLMWEEMGREADRVNGLRDLYQQNVMDYGLALGEKAELANQHMLKLADDVAKSLSPQKLGEFGDAAGSIAMRALDDFTAFAIGAGDSISDFVGRAMKDLARLLIRLAIIQTLKAAFSGATGGVGGAVLSAIEGRASGGPVRGGQSYMVGERGPERFVPATDGYIVPNGGGAAAIMDMLPLGRPMTPGEASRDAWHREFVRRIVTDMDRRGR